MKKVGLLVGREQTFPQALINSINEQGAGRVTAEMVEVGGVRAFDEAKRYDLVIDRISHEIPFYRAFMKRLALEGAITINNPFWWSADDKFFNFSLAHKLGVATPRTILLPQKNYIAGVTGESLRNLEFPLDWQAIVDYVGFPAIIKPFDGGGWKNVSRVDSLEQLWSVFDETDTLCMTLQEFIPFDQFVRCYCIGQEEVMIMPYDPRKPYLSGEQYLHNPDYLSPELAERVTRDVKTLCRALGYDINTVEFAIRGDVPYAIDFMNPAPDADIHSVGEFYHNWVTDAVTRLVFKKLEAEADAAPRYRWDAMLNLQAAPQSAQEAVSEAGASIAHGVSEFVSDAANAISDIVDSVTKPKARGAKRAGAATDSSATKTPKKAGGSSTRRKKPETDAS